MTTWTRVRPATFPVLFAVLVVNAAPVVAFQETGHEGHVMPAETEAQETGTDRIRLVDSPENKKLVIELGPIDLPAGISHHDLVQIPVQEAVLPFDFTIRGFYADAVDAAGNQVPREVLHHANVLDPRRRELFLPIMLRIMASSHETPPVALPGWLFGIPMRAGNPVLALAMLHNPTAESYEGVVIRIHLDYERRARLPIYPVVPFHLDTMFPNAERKAFDLPPGRSSQSYESSPAVSGLILGLSGHLHRYATRLRLENLTTGDVLYDIVPGTDEDGHIEDIPVLLHRGKGLGARIESSHVYRVTAEYVNPTGEVIVDGGMGAVGGAFLPLEDWPAANPADPLYQRDYDWVLLSQTEHGGGHEHGSSDQTDREEDDGRD